MNGSLFGLTDSTHLVEGISVSNETPLRSVRTARRLWRHLGIVQQALSVVVLRAGDQAGGGEVRTGGLLAGQPRRQEEVVAGAQGPRGGGLAGDLRGGGGGQLQPGLVSVEEGEAGGVVEDALLLTPGLLLAVPAPAQLVVRLAGSHQRESVLSLVVASCLTRLLGRTGGEAAALAGSFFLLPSLLIRELAVQRLDCRTS